MIAVAGTPPDAFSKDGQLWGMPTFRWDVLEATSYKWWVDRLKRVIQFFDLVRLDHFRAFSAYWEIPAGQPAKNGSWKAGPGAVFFETAKTELGELPFVAEDLGAVDEQMVELREQFNLPGMKVLQFAFDDNMPGSDYIPHNYGKNFLVYTGTHDNNTSRGWFRQEADDSKKSRIMRYIGKGVGEEEIANEMIRLAYGSVGNMAIVPLQDILNLDESARMNFPSSFTGNWKWRVLPEEISTNIEDKLKEWAWLFNRD